MQDFKPWSRQPGESDVAYRAFRTYLELGATRDLNKVGEMLHPSENRKRGRTSAIAGWSSRWDWRDRAAAWDSDQLEARREAERRLVAAEVDEAAAIRRKIRQDAQRDYETIAESIRKRFEPGPDGTPASITPNDLKALSLARQKIRELIGDMTFGLPDPDQAPAGDGIPPELAPAWEAFLADWVARQSGSVDAAPSFFTAD